MIQLVPGLRQLARTWDNSPSAHRGQPVRGSRTRASCLAVPPPPPRGRVLTPNFGRYVPRQSEKLARVLERAWKCGAPESRNELENVELRNELEPFWAWKCGAPERAWSILSVKMRISGTAANPRRCRTLCVRAEPAVGDDERVELKLKKFWKWWSPERQKM